MLMQFRFLVFSKCNRIKDGNGKNTHPHTHTDTPTHTHTLTHSLTPLLSLSCTHPLMCLICLWETDNRAIWFPFLFFYFFRFHFLFLRYLTCWDLICTLRFMTY